MTFIFRYMGTMAGAVHAGQRAAIEVLNILRPQSLTSQDYYLLKEINQKYQEEKAKPDPGHSYLIRRIFPKGIVVKDNLREKIKIF